MTDISDLTLEEKAGLTSGQDAWHLQSVPGKGVPGYMITDGPHGLRKATHSTQMDLNGSVPATCFPPACALASSWNPDLIRQVGETLGQECAAEKVAVVLGPGINIKRNPLGGRCFEYWSEDPYLTGHEAAALVDGVQSRGIGTSLKHFAANNQETDRMSVDIRISARALREIYLPAFEYVVKHSQPWTVMCSYNKVNGAYSSENHWLLTDVLRDEWGFKGIVMSDWGACHDRVKALNAGLNLEMPPSHTDHEIVQAVHDGRIEERQLNSMAAGMLQLAEQAAPAMNEDSEYDVDDHDAVARRAAAESIVLLKNQHGILPLPDKRHVTVIGEFARTMRYQGGGSSHINPNRLTSFLDAIRERGINAEFAPGFTLDDEPQRSELTEQALAAAEHADTVLLFIGLPEHAESEGADRTTLDIPAKQISLLHEITAVNPRIVVIVSNGSAVTMNWEHHAQAIVEAWLPGQAGGSALADVLYGDVDPSGRLAQTIPCSINDDPSMMNWPGEEGHVDYGEGVFVGYRYYDTFDKPIRYPFGYGLSYTDFAIDDVSVSVDGPCSVTVSCTVTNTGARGGSQTVQCYVAPPRSKVARPVHELKGFVKVHLAPGERRDISMHLSERAFAYWSTIFDDWHVEPGVYGIEVALSSRHIIASVDAPIQGDGKTLPLTRHSTLGEWLDDPLIGPAAAQTLNKSVPDDPAMRAMVRSMPFSSLAELGGPDGVRSSEELVAVYERLAGHPIAD